MGFARRQERTLYFVDRFRKYFSTGFERLNFWIGAGILAALCLLFFKDCLGYYFAQEDFYAFKTSIQTASQLKEAFIPSKAVYSYRPLGTVYFTVMQAFFGHNPVPYHIANLFVHILIVIIIYKLGRILFGETAGFLSALFFALRGVNFLPVYWAVNITQALPVLTISGAFLSFVLFRTEKKTIYYFLALGLCVISVSLHEMSIFLPVILALYLVLIDELPNRKKAFIAQVPFYLIILIYVVLRFRLLALLQAGAASDLVPVHPEARLQRLFLMWNLCFNAGEMIILSFSRPRILSLHPLNYLFQVVLAGAVVAAVLLMKVRRNSRQEIRRFLRWLLFSVIFALMPLVLMSSFFFVRPYRLNFAAIGTSFFSAILISTLFNRKWILLPAVAYILLSFFSFRLIRQFDYESIIARQKIARNAIRDMQEILETRPFVSTVYIGRFDDWNIFPAIRGGDAFESVISPPVSLVRKLPQDEQKLRNVLHLIYMRGHLRAVQ